MNRVQSKVKDTNSQEAFFKLSSLIDYYNKAPQYFKEVIIIKSSLSKKKFFIYQ